MTALEGIRVISLATNIPGPVAAARLRDMGAAVLKVEPPAGDALAEGNPAWYADLHEGVEVVSLDLKTKIGKEKLHELLPGGDLLISSSRPSSLRRLGLEWSELGRRCPRLCQVAIVGHLPPEEEKPGHDLTYQASLGLVQPPDLPLTLLADHAGAERAVSAALALLYRRERAANDGRDLEAGDRFAWIPLGEAAVVFAEPLRYGLTGPGGLLGGSLPEYNLYKTREGWIAVAALESHFLAKLARELGFENVTKEALEKAFLARTAAEWEEWAVERDVPLAALKGTG